MGRGFCQRKNWEKDFGSKVKGYITGAGIQCKKMAQVLDTTEQTLSRRFKNPSSMRLSDLKCIIRLTELPKEEVIKYLYEEE